MGKRVSKDADRGKATYPALLGEEASRTQAKKLVEEACRAVEPLEERGQHLIALAHFIIERDR